MTYTIHTLGWSEKWEIQNILLYKRFPITFFTVAKDSQLFCSHNISKTI